MKQTLTHIVLFSLIGVPTTYAISINHNRIIPAASSVNNISAQLASANVIYLNKAAANSLMRLKGIGKKRAEDILAYRNLHGPFQKIEDLASVPGLNKKFVNRLLKKNESIKILI
jgi:competence protein ComEA